MLRYGYADDVVVTNEISGMFSEIEVNLSEGGIEFTGMVWLFCGLRWSACAGARNSVPIVVGCCSVEYVGWGERIVVVKPDGSVLVHQRAGREPVNWQPPGTQVRCRTETDNDTPMFVIYSYRFKPPEKMY